MEKELPAAAARRTEIGARLDRIKARIRELADGLGADGDKAADRLMAAERHAAASLAASREALSASLEAFHRAAKAHDHLAEIYEKSAASADDNERAAFHRSAADADRARAAQTQVLLDANQDTHGTEQRDP